MSKTLLVADAGYLLGRIAGPLAATHDQVRVDHALLDDAMLRRRLVVHSSAAYLVTSFSF
jgi:hypothetical protein